MTDKDIEKALVHAFELGLECAFRLSHLRDEPSESSYEPQWVKDEYANRSWYWRAEKRKT